MYTYEATAERVVDGDTIRVIAEQYFSWPDETVTAERSFVVRLLEVDTPEIRGETREAGLAAAAFVRSVLFEDGVAVPLKLELTGKRDVYGRWLGYIYVVPEETYLASMIINAEHGRFISYSSLISRLGVVDQDLDLEDEEIEQE